MLQALSGGGPRHYKPPAHHFIESGASSCKGGAEKASTLPPPSIDSAELSHSSQVLYRRRNTPKSAQNRWESVCAGLWVPCRVFWVRFGPF